MTRYPLPAGIVQHRTARIDSDQCLACGDRVNNGGLTHAVRIETENAEYTAEWVLCEGDIDVIAEGVIALVCRLRPAATPTCDTRLTRVSAQAERPDVCRPCDSNPATATLRRLGGV